MDKPKIFIGIAHNLIIQDIERLNLQPITERRLDDEYETYAIERTYNHPYIVGLTEYYDTRSTRTMYISWAYN